LPNRDEPHELVESASAAGGAIAGVALSLVAGPFVGSAGGELVGRALLRVGVELQQRLFAPMQDRRVGEAFLVAVNRARQRLDQGESPRDDGFFEPIAPGEAAPAEELLEGTMLAASNAYEQRKVPLLGRLYTSFAFTKIDPAHASWLIGLADELTYRQLILLSIFGYPDHEEFAEIDARIAQSVVGPEVGLVDEMEELAARGLLGIDADGLVLAPGDSELGSSNFVGVPLARIRPRRSGAILAELMELDTLSEEDRRAVIMEFDPDTYSGSPSDRDPSP
jgi:hypothetical protein